MPGAQPADIDHERTLGFSADVLSASTLAPGTISPLQSEELIGAWGFDPRERRSVDYDGAEAQLARIAHPQAEYHSPALLLVADVLRIDIRYPLVATAVTWESQGPLAIFREESGNVRVISLTNPTLSHEISSHLGADVRAEVWRDEVVMTCSKGGEVLFELALARKPSGLFAYNHRS